MSNYYMVRWVIQIDADSPEDASKLAWKIMKEKENMATFLDVYDGEDDQLINTFDMADLEE